MKAKKISELQAALHKIRYPDGDAGPETIPPRYAFARGEVHINANHINDGVVLFSGYLGMSGSAGEIDLYKLNQAYLLDPEMRESMNELLRDWDRKRFVVGGH